MFGKSPKDAIQNFAIALNQTLACVTESRFSAYQTSEKLYKVFLPTQARVTASNGDRFYVQATQVCVVEPLPDAAFKVHTRQYSYVFSDSNTATHHGVVSYHWHPDDFAVRDPHLHLRLTPQLKTPEIERKIARAHFPTSRVCLEDFVALLIGYYDVKPLVPGWKRVCRNNKTAFGQQATWRVKRGK